LSSVVTVNPGGILGGSSGPPLGLQSGHGTEAHVATDNELVRNILLAVGKLGES
jgi:hypothetical protein